MGRAPRQGFEANPCGRQAAESQLFNTKVTKIAKDTKMPVLNAAILSRPRQSPTPLIPAKAGIQDK
jgi:hypothetical protein